MPKITLSPIVNITNVAAINSNFEKIASEINNKMFSRNPEGEPNVLDTNIDLNGNKLLNVPKPTSPTDLVRLQDLDDSVEVDLSGKQDVLISGTNIKTVNNQSLLGSGNIDISGSVSNDHSLALNRTLPDQHPISAITGLQTSLDGKAAVAHSHAISDVTNLQATLDGKANTSHTHAISDVTGLSTALSGKQDTLVSGTNIKTVNGNSLVGSGDVSITTGESNTASNLGAGTGVFASKVGVDLRFKSLVAGTNVTLSNDANTVTINSTASGGTSDHSVLTNRDAADQHPISAITGLQTALDGKASTSHSHVIADVTGLQTALDGKQPLDGDLTAIAALSTNGVPKRTGTDTWAVLADVKEIVVSTTAPGDTTKLWLDIN